MPGLCGRAARLRRSAEMCLISTDIIWRPQTALPFSGGEGGCRAGRLPAWSGCPSVEKRRGAGRRIGGVFEPDLE